MKRTAITLLILVGLIAFSVKTAEAGPASAIVGGVASQTLAKSHHHGHHGNYGHYGPRPHYGYRPPVVYVPPRPVVVRPYIYNDPYMLQHGGFYYSGQGFSFGFGY